jgi:hypothetical protein
LSNDLECLVIVIAANIAAHGDLLSWREVNGPRMSAFR